jgi:hypothetical protein
MQQGDGSPRKGSNATADKSSSARSVLCTQQPYFEQLLCNGSYQLQHNLPEGGAVERRPPFHIFLRSSTLLKIFAMSLWMSARSWQRVSASLNCAAVKVDMEFEHQLQRMGL